MRRSQCAFDMLNKGHLSHAQSHLQDVHIGCIRLSAVINDYDVL